MHTLDDGTAG